MEKRSKFNIAISIIIAILLIATIITRLGLDIPNLVVFKMVFYFSLAIFGWVHGIKRYGFKNMFIWFIVTWIISNFFEGLSVKMGFPFGNYHYTAPGPRIFEVPVYIMIAYFGIVYVSWTVTQSLLAQFNEKIQGFMKFVLPISTAIVMTMWDLSTDVVSSQLVKTWIWEDGGGFFGVPISNFVGWVFVVYCFMQVFTLFISNKNYDVSKDNVTSKKVYWLQATIVYLIMGLGLVLEGFTQKNNVDIYQSMAMISVFTVVFVSMLAINNIIKNKELQ